MSWQNWNWRCTWNRWGLGDRWSLSISGVRGWRWRSHTNIRGRRCRCERKRGGSWRGWLLGNYCLRGGRCRRWRFEFLFLAPSSTFWRRSRASELFIFCQGWSSWRCSDGNRLLDAHQLIRSRLRRSAGIESGYGNWTALRYRRLLLVLCVVLLNCGAF